MGQFIIREVQINKKDHVECSFSTLMAGMILSR